MSPIQFNSLNPFTERAYYIAHFMDLAVWERYVRYVCQVNHIQCSKVSPGVPGTFPTFIVEPGTIDPSLHLKPVVVKFFGPLFSGSDSFSLEREIGMWLQLQPLPIPSPAILAQGKLNAEWSYLVFEAIPGVSIGQAREKLKKDDQIHIAQEIGKTLHNLHSRRLGDHLNRLTSPGSSAGGFTKFLSTQHDICIRNHKSWKDIPEHFIDELATFIIPVEKLVDPSCPLHLIHADLTSDHILGTLDHGGWQTHAIIDWGDARIGNILYELVALHLDLFRGDVELLHAFLEAYCLPDFYHDDFRKKALSMVLLHQYPVPAWIFKRYADSHNLEELAERIFG